MRIGAQPFAPVSVRRRREPPSSSARRRMENCLFVLRQLVRCAGMHLALELGWPRAETFLRRSKLAFQTKRD